MTIEFQVIENCLQSTTNAERLLSFMSVQERERLLGLLFSSLSEFVERNQMPNASNAVGWSEGARQVLAKALNDAQDFFGVKNLDEKIFLGEFLKKIIEAERS